MALTPLGFAPGAIVRGSLQGYRDQVVGGPDWTGNQSRPGDHEAEREQPCDDLQGPRADRIPKDPMPPTNGEIAGGLPSACG